MRMATLALIGASLVLTGTTTPAIAGGKPGAQAPRVGMGGTAMHRWGPRHNGRWFAGWRAPGGWGAYRRPVHGYILPRYWISPAYYIANYGAYGLPAPAHGYGWSRYYDDAVMTDRYGRVYDYRSDVDWDRHEGGYDDRYPGPPRRDDGVGGAVIGVVVGGVAGNRIAGRGNRTAGTLIGAGVGAVAGMAIDKAEDGPRHAPPPPHHRGADYDDGRGYDDDVVARHGDDGESQYDGRWTGTWTTDDGRKVSGTYEGRFEGDVRGAGVDYDAPPYGPGPHWGAGPAPMVSHGGGYIAGGYYYPAPIVTTVTVQPAATSTTTTSYVTEKVRYRTSAGKVRRACRCK